MKDWEFLLQKEGDRSWLPLDSPAVEILEGRYRIVARSRWSNAEVQIRVSHLVIDEDHPKRRIQKRTGQTSKEGLMVVIPFTRLEPGLWELHCTSTDLMSELVGDAWQFAVKLQVSANDAEEEDIWEPNWSTQTPTDSQIETATPSPETPLVTPSSNGFVANGVVTNADTVASDPPHESVPESTTPASDTDQALADQPIAPSEAISPPENPAPTTLTPEVAEILSASMDRLFQIAEQMSNQLVDEVLRDFDLAGNNDLTERIASSPAPVSSEVAPVTPPNLPSDQPIVIATGSNDVTPGYTLPSGEAFRLTLAQETLVASRGQTLTLTGLVTVEPLTVAGTDSPLSSSNFTSQITSQTPTETDPWASEEQALNLSGATAQELQLYLRDPQSLQILVSDRYPLPNQSEAIPFSFSFSLPQDTTTHLVLGEVLLCGYLPDQAQSLITLTSQSFTITADPQELVGELAKLNEVLDETLAAQTEDERLDLPLELSQRLAKEQAPPSLNLSFLDSEPEPVEPTEAPVRFPSLAGQPLPPQLYHPDPDQPRSKIELPAFGVPTHQVDQPTTDLPLDVPPAEPASVPNTENTTAPLSEPVEVASPLVTTPLEVTDGEGSAHEDDSTPVPDLIAEAEASAPPISPSTAPATHQDLDTTESDSPIEEESHQIDLPSPIQMGFQSLRLQDRFLTRLSSLATDTELSNWLRNNLYPERAATWESAPVQPPTEEKGGATAEFVVDDEPVTPPNRQRRGRKVPEVTETTIDKIDLSILPDDEPVPLPELDITTGELVSGQPVNIRVKLPNVTSRIYVKLWVTDRQSRSLLDGPRWLLDFLPTGLGHLEAITQLTVPFGSLEVRFEAIAIEMHTQRESHKVGIERKVIPPDLPVVSLEGFDT